MTGGCLFLCGIVLHPSGVSEGVGRSVANMTGRLFLCGFAFHPSSISEGVGKAWCQYDRWSPFSDMRAENYIMP